MTAETLQLEQTLHRMHEALIVPGAVPPDLAEALFRQTGRLGAADGLAVYQRSYFLRLASCMREQFPALCHALGADLFNDFTADYIRDYPPESHTLYDLGRRFPAFLEETQPDSEKPEPWVEFMIELARFERQIFVMFDAPGHEGKPFADAGTLDAHLALQPCFDVGSYSFPVAAYYHAVRRTEQPALPPREASHVALVRRDYLTHTVPIAPTHFLFLQAMRSGANVAEALEAVATHYGLPLPAVQASWSEAGGVRARWIDAGFFIDTRTA